MRQSRGEYWSRTISAQESSGLSVRVFCQERGVNVHSFYMWRRRIADSQPVAFAELKTIAGGVGPSAIEIVLTTGERLHVPNGVDLATLHLVLEALRS